MKPLTSVLLTCVLVLSVIALGRHFSKTPAVHAQTGCDATSVSGPYGYQLNGSVYDNAGNLYFLASAGRLVADGNGALTGADTYSLDGTIVKRTYTGTYSINADCTGSMTLQITIGNTSVTTHGDIVTVNNGTEMNFVQTDTNYIFSGVFKKQKP